MSCEECYEGIARQLDLFQQSVWYIIAMLGIFVLGFLLGWMARRPYADKKLQAKIERYGSLLQR
jgi:hypothetical protein